MSELRDIFEKHRYRVTTSASKIPQAGERQIQNINKEIMSRKLAECFLKRADLEWDDFMNEVLATLEIFIFTRKELADMMRTIESEVLKKYSFPIERFTP